MAQLLVEDGLQIVGAVLFLRGCFGHVHYLSFSRPPLCARCSRLECRLVGYPVQPVADHFSRRDRRCLADEDEEGGLKCVLGIVMVTEDAATNAPDDRAVPS